MDHIYNKIDEYINAFNLGAVLSKLNKEHFQLIHFKKGKLICDKEDELNHLYMIVKGKVKVYTITPEGKKLILSFINPLAIVGDIELIQNCKVNNVVEACSDIEAISIPFDIVRKTLLHDSSFLRFLLDYIASTLKNSTEFTSLNLLYPVEVRVASYLLSISTDSNGNSNKEYFDVISVSSIADFIGASYRHVIRVLQKFYNEDLIEKKNGVISIKDFSKMNEIAKNNIYESAER